MRTPPHSILAAALFAALIPTSSHADPLVTIETVQVGDAGNPADTTGYGAVASAFNIGKYEVTISQYAAFLNTVAAITSDSYIVNLWDSYMWTDANIAGISRSGAGTLASPYVYSVVGPMGATPPGASSPGNRPIAYVSWFDAARFANWVNNGAAANSSTETGAYTLNGAESGIYTVNPGATWCLPSEDQWYKAAYYKGGGTNAGYWGYPTQSDTTPGNTIGSGTNQANFNTGKYAVTQSSSYSRYQNYLTDAGAFSNSASAYGTYDQGGNLKEWNDAVIDDSSRGWRGGNWYSEFGMESSTSGSSPPESADYTIGFRLANVPEPSTYALLLMGAGALYVCGRRKIARS